MKKFFRFLRSMPIYMGDVVLAVLSFFGSHFVLKFAILFIMQAVNPIQNGHIRDFPPILDVALVIFSVAISTGVVLIWHKGEHGWKKLPDKKSDNASSIYSEDIESNDIQYQKKEDISPITVICSRITSFSKISLILLFKQLRVLHKLPRGYVKVLRVASYMHDVGKRISYKNHALHSFEVILNVKFMD